MKTKLSTLAEFLQVLRYEPNTGLFFWTADVANNVKQGRQAGTKGFRGYVSLNYLGKAYKLHRLAWLFTYKEWPELSIDHINGIKDDNRIINLRQVTISQNGQNRKPSRTNKTGFKGVRAQGKKYRAEINHQKKYFHLGVFDTMQEAANAYADAAKKIHTHNNTKRI